MLRISPILVALMAAGLAVASEPASLLNASYDVTREYFSRLRPAMGRYSYLAAWGWALRQPVVTRPRPSHSSQLPSPTCQSSIPAAAAPPRPSSSVAWATSS